jgi:hypothetical protein
MIKRTMLCGMVLAVMASVAHAHPGGLNAEGRHNTAGCGTMQFINLTVTGMGGRRLTYRELTNGN